MTAKKRYLAVVLAALMLPSLAHAAPSLEVLLRQANIQAQKTEQGFYKIVVEGEEDTIIVFAKEGKLGETEISVVNIYAVALQMPKDFQPPQAMLKKMVALNDDLNYGKVIQEGNMIFYKSTFLLQNADSHSLEIELQIAHVWRNELRRQLMPFVKE